MHPLHIVQFSDTVAPLPLDSLGSSEPSQCRRGENAVEKIQFDHLLPFLLTGQGEVNHLIHTVIDGPVKLVRLVAGNDQHEPVAVRERGGEGCGGGMRMRRERIGGMGVEEEMEEGEEGGGRGGSG